MLLIGNHHPFEHRGSSSHGEIIMSSASEVSGVSAPDLEWQARRGQFGRANSMPGPTGPSSPPPCTQTSKIVCICLGLHMRHGNLVPMFHVQHSASSPPRNTPCSASEVPNAEAPDLAVASETEFVSQGKQYAWNYWVFLGSTLYLREVASGEELAVVQLLPTWRWQIISSWSWRSPPPTECLEVRAVGRSWDAGRICGLGGFE